MNETETLDNDTMVKQIIAADKAKLQEPIRRDPFRRLTIGYNPIRGRNVGRVRKSRGIPVIYRESSKQSDEPGVTLLDRILVLPRRGRAEPKDDPTAQEKAIAKRNRKGRKLEDAVASGGWGAQ